MREARASARGPLGASPYQLRVFGVDTHALRRAPVPARHPAVRPGGAPHHSLELSPDESTLCAAGRASDYVALVSTEQVGLGPKHVESGWARASVLDSREPPTAPTR
jgi:hypothetical protein